MKNKVFGIGLSRTGTTTLYKVLTELGYKSAHSSGRLIADNSFDIMRDYDALVDSPVPMLYRDLDRRHPNSKFILTTRAKPAWLESMKWMFTHGKVDWDWTPRVHGYHKQFYGTRTFDAAILSSMYDAFHAQVHEYFRDRPADLFVIEIEHGIDTIALCNFLGIPPREVTVPRANARRHVGAFRRFRYWIKEQLGLR
jgi:hypothetical protein